MNGPNSEPDQKNLLLAIVLSAGVLLMWQATLPPPVQQPAEPGTSAPSPTPVTATPNSAAPVGGQPGQAKAPAEAAPAFTKAVVATLEVAEHQGITISNDGGQLDTWTLFEGQYLVPGVGDAPASPFVFVHNPAAKPDKSLFIPPRVGLSLNGKPSTGEFKVTQSNATSARLEWTDPGTGVIVSKDYSVNAERFTVDVKLGLRNPGSNPVSYDVDTLFQALQRDEDAAGSMFMPPIHLYESVCQRADDFERMAATAIIEAKEDEDPTSFKDGIKWAGVDNRYFMTGLVVPEGNIEECSVDAAPEKGAPGFTRLSNRVNLVGGMLQPGQSVERSLTLYGGPKKRSELDALSVPMTNAIDFGIFSVICVPMLWLMGLFYSYIANWGVAIILLTILVKLITLPLTIKQYRSMGAMKKIQPLMKKLQEKHSEDKVRMQQEMMKLYKEHNVNPLAGCLPMLMMMPIYFALYRTIFSAVELYQADFFLWITDLSQQDPYYITPLLLGVLMVVQFKLNPSAGDQMQTKIMMYVMPVMFTGMMLFLPSGLVLYILVNTILGICQQYYIYRQADVADAQPAT